MPKGYWIVHVDVTDAERYKEYVRLDTPVIAQWGGRLLARGGACEGPEGPIRARHVIIEFDSFQTAQDCWRSAEYQQAAAIRRAAAQSEIVIVEGVA